MAIVMLVLIVSTALAFCFMPRRMSIGPKVLLMYQVNWCIEDSKRHREQDEQENESSWLLTGRAREVNHGSMPLAEKTLAQCGDSRKVMCGQCHALAVILTVSLVSSETGEGQ